MSFKGISTPLTLSETILRRHFPFMEAPVGIAHGFVLPNLEILYYWREWGDVLDD